MFCYYISLNEKISYYFEKKNNLSLMFIKSPICISAIPLNVSAPLEKSETFHLYSRNFNRNCEKMLHVNLVEIDQVNI